MQKSSGTMCGGFEKPLNTIRNKEISIMMNSEELIAKYGNQQQAPNQSPKLSKPEDYIFYSQNSFKRFMGYEEPDYLQVAGLYASAESSSKSKIYGSFLVKKADYAAKMLKWYTDDGKLDIERAERAIRYACRTESPNGLYYMYTVSNKNKCLSDKGSGSIYMSGKRYAELQEELANRMVAYESIAKQTSQSIDSEILENENDLNKVRKMVRKLASIYGFYGYEEGAVVWVAKHLLDILSVEEIRNYFNQITSKPYCRQAQYNSGCPQLNSIFDVFHKYDKIQRFMSDRKRHIVTPDL